MRECLSRRGGGGGAPPPPPSLASLVSPPPGSHPPPTLLQAVGVRLGVCLCGMGFVRVCVCVQGKDYGGLAHILTPLWSRPLATHTHTHTHTLTSSRIYESVKCACVPPLRPHTRPLSPLSPQTPEPPVIPSLSPPPQLHPSVLTLSHVTLGQNENTAQTVRVLPLETKTQSLVTCITAFNVDWQCLLYNSLHRHTA